MLSYLDEILLHVSRGVRWDSDHVVTLTDELQAIAQELVRGDYLDRVHIGLDFFDASINRVAAWVIGTRACSRRCCSPCSSRPRRSARSRPTGDYTARLAAARRSSRRCPFGAVWDHYCLTQDVPVGRDWLAEVKAYERDVLSNAMIRLPVVRGGYLEPERHEPPAWHESTRR